jgi:UPF0271 protein
METSLKNAQAHQLKIGAHPGYPDPDNFGRNVPFISDQALLQSLFEQINRLMTIASRQSIALSHIKLHGALYNEVERRSDLAQSIALLCQKNFPSMSLLGLAEGELEAACKSNNIRFIGEGFMDRSYQKNGTLTPRKFQGSVYTDSKKVIEQATALATGSPFTTYDGKVLARKVDSICLHGDNPNALELIRDLNNHWVSNNIVIGPKNSNDN